MIEINLLPGSGKKNRSTGFSLKAIAGQAGSRVKDPFMIAAAVSILAATGSIGYLHMSQTAKADDLTERERRAVQDSTRYVAVLRERNRALAQRDSVQRQLEIIKSIDNDCFIWAHIMDEVSRALPLRHRRRHHPRRRRMARRATASLPRRRHRPRPRRRPSSSRSLATPSTSRRSRAS